MSFLYDRLMRIHLITAESPASRRLRFCRLIQFPQLTMPLIAALTPPEHEVSHTDEIVERVRFDAPADLVGITAPTPSALHAYDIARQFRRRGVPVVIGGPHATALPEEAARHADAVVVGEAEDTWPHVLDDARRGKLEQVYVSSRQAPLVHMPAPRWDLIKGRRYGKSVTIATRGCPHRCDYCSIPLLYGPATVRYRPIDEVVREVATSPTRAVVFWDDNIGANPRYAKELFRALAPLGKWWTSQCTANAARDEQLVELAARSGCKALFLGLESISQESLDATNKGHNRVDAYRRLIAMLHRYGVAVHLGIMFGFDQDDAGIFRRTAEFLEEASVDVATVSMVVPMPGTPTFRRLSGDGRILTTDWSKY
ncbi:MAG: B12-binding domain-containing radical SAM protein, partial [Acidobacteria bacterium 13_1_20CM_2_55_15]